jgi:hypothetical protein
MASSQQDKHVLPSEIPRLLDEPLTDSDLQSSVSDVDYDQEKESKKVVIMKKIVMITMKMFMLWQTVKCSAPCNKLTVSLETIKSHLLDKGDSRK